MYLSFTDVSIFFMIYFVCVNPAMALYLRPICEGHEARDKVLNCIDETTIWHLGDLNSSSNLKLWQI